MPARDIVVIGGSAGGIPALIELLAAMQPDLDASVFIAIHTSPDGGGMLPEILQRGSKWPVIFARDHERIRRAHIYVAPPDHHLLLRRTVVQLTRGPRENRFRPAVDPLFRTAAQVFNRRVIGIVLSGGLDDGTHGLELVKLHGGVAIAQDPEEALQPSMPLSAIQNVEVDHILPAAAIGVRLAQLIGEQVEEIPDTDPKEPDVAEGTADNQNQVTGPPSEYTCPECGGTLWELGGGKVLRYRCHVGHGYTADSLLADQSDSLENALWGALRALEEHAMLRRRMADHAQGIGRGSSAREFEREAKRTELRASTIRRLLQAERPARLTGSGQAAETPRRLPGVKEPRPGTRVRRVNR
jgi:two-component system chemotaxis response regulator CheB